MRITKALPALVLLLAMVAGTASAYISENPRQGLAPISAEFHPEPTGREPGTLLGFELRFLGFCVRSGLSYTDPSGLWLITSNGQGQIYAIAERAGESLADLTPPFPSNITDAGQDVCEIAAGTEIEITKYFSPSIQAVIDKGGPANCFAAVMAYPNVSLSTLFQDRAAFLTWLNNNGFTSVSLDPEVGRIIRFNFTAPQTLSSGEVVAAGDPTHVGVVIYVSKISGIPSIFNKIQVFSIAPTAPGYYFDQLSWAACNFNY